MRYLSNWWHPRREAASTASLVVAVLALVSAMGASAYAGGKIATQQIKDGAVTSAKIRDKNVKTPDLKGDAVTSSRIRNKNVKPPDLHPKTKARAWVKRPGAPVDLTYSTNQAITVMSPLTFTVPTAGFLEVNAYATGLGMNEPDEYFALLDYDGSAVDVGELFHGSPTQAQVDHFYNSLVAYRSAAGDTEFPRRVDRGSHAIQFIAHSNDGAVAGEPTQLILRSLTAEFQPGVSGTQGSWTFPPRAGVRGRSLLPH